VDGLLAPKGTPAAIIDKIYRDVKDVLATNEVKSYMATAASRSSGRRPRSSAHSSVTSARSGRKASSEDEEPSRGMSDLTRAEPR
jgi:hypothetical protein